MATPLSELKGIAYRRWHVHLREVLCQYLILLVLILRRPPSTLRGSISAKTKIEVLAARGDAGLHPAGVLAELIMIEELNARVVLQLEDARPCWGEAHLARLVSLLHSGRWHLYQAATLRVAERTALPITGVELLPGLTG